MTLAPLVVKDKVIVGVAGGEFGIRGFIAAFDARTGREVWRFYTIPGPGEPGHETWQGDAWEHGGGSVWMTGSYDPILNLTYWGSGNPGPDWNPANAGGQSVLRFGPRARPGYRQTQMVFFNSRPTTRTIMTRSGPGAGRYHLEWQRPQTDDVGQPQRILLTSSIV